MYGQAPRRTNNKLSEFHTVWPPLACPGETISLIHRTQVHIIYQWGVKQIPSHHQVWIQYRCIFHHGVL